MSELSREIGEIWTRLFDHRPFLNGEIKFMLKEFEEKRGDREVENLFSILENLTDIKDTQIERINKSGKTGLPILSEKLMQGLQLCEEIEKDYSQIQQVCKQKRCENQEKRQKEWDQFIDDMNFKCQRIDNTFEEKEEELRDLYADLNHKLNITNNNIKDLNQKNQESSKTCDNIDNSVIKENKMGEEELKTESDKKGSPFLNTCDIDWLYAHINKRRKDGEKDVPFLHVLFEGSHIELPQNEIIIRNPVLEARCVKLRAQQEAREYRKMTKSVDNVRMRFPEDSISYQMKQLNRQLIAIGQFIISIFAGFLFGFRGVEWMVGNLDFGFRLLLGVMCALVIALAEIYFLAKKLNEELNVPETVQLGGPPKFVNEPYFGYKDKTSTNKEHQD
ncbi:unnamed protein product [Parnassius apollo]|uniref:Biogenesis of lysosome-related organelles complex 1 subunit 5 n=1 Tax=Parnassius apollo TaxID=110799 RepID=A0A8S3WTM7_PARAO|nr:unnamed protein product [Parnassius apollo]